MWAKLVAVALLKCSTCLISDLVSKRGKRENKEHSSDFLLLFKKYIWRKKNIGLMVLLVYFYDFNVLMLKIKNLKNFISARF